MSYSVIAIPKSKKELKKLAKKYPSLKNEFETLIQSLEAKPEQGIALGNNCYKIRLAIKSKGQGNSAGARVITNIAITDYMVYLLSIYDKADKESLSEKDLIELIAELDL